MNFFLLFLAGQAAAVTISNSTILETLFSIGNLSSGHNVTVIDSVLQLGSVVSNITDILDDPLANVTFFAPLDSAFVRIQASESAKLALVRADDNAEMDGDLEMIANRSRLEPSLIDVLSYHLVDSVYTVPVACLNASNTSQAIGSIAAGSPGLPVGQSSFFHKALRLFGMSDEEEFEVEADKNATCSHGIATILRTFLTSSDSPVAIFSANQSQVIIANATENDKVMLKSGSIEPSYINSTIHCTNGVLHLVSNVLEVPMLTSSYLSAANYTEALGSIIRANLTDLIDNHPGMTLFAPINGNYTNGTFFGNVSIESLIVLDDALYSPLLNGNATRLVALAYDNSNLTMSYDNSTGVFMVNDTFVIEDLNGLSRNGVVQGINKK